MTGVLLLLFVSVFALVFLWGIGERRWAIGFGVPGLVLGLAGVAVLLALGAS